MISSQGDPPASYERKPSFHEREVVTPTPPSQLATTKETVLARVDECGGIIDCSSLCDPADSLVATFFDFAGKNNSSSTSVSYDEYDHPFEELNKNRQDAASVDSNESSNRKKDPEPCIRQKRGRFLIWPVGS